MTALVTAVYAFLVWQTLKELKQQRLDSVLPALSLARSGTYVPNRLNSAAKFEVRNVGLGPAFNVKMGGYKVKSWAVGESEEVQMWYTLPMKAGEFRVELVYQDIWSRYIVSTFVLTQVGMPKDVPGTLSALGGPLKSYELQMEFVGTTVTDSPPSQAAEASASAVRGPSEQHPGPQRPLT